MSTSQDLIPKIPLKPEDTELDFGFLADLALKIVYADTNCTTERAAEKLKLSMPVTEELLQHLYREKFVEIRGLITYGNNRYGMLDRGWQRAQRLLDMNGYIGPAPVSLEAYTTMMLRQSAATEMIQPDAVRTAMSGLVLPEATVQTLGLVASSRRSLFMTGPSGNGKTTIATALHSAQSGEIWIPYAIEVDGQIIKVFDLHNHQPVSVEGLARYDGRWTKIKRPLVIVGGEMTIDTMDLIYSQTVRFYEAPFQMKANGGTLVIDDFGRQRIDPHELLNRWIVPLEGRVDYLTLHTGKKIEVPFEMLIIFSTNLDPADLVDEAFLRRIRYKIGIEAPTVAQYEEIFKRMCARKNIEYRAESMSQILAIYRTKNIGLRSCHPRDIIEQLIDTARFLGQPPALTSQLVEMACESYFVSLDPSGNPKD